MWNGRMSRCTNRIHSWGQIAKDGELWFGIVGGTKMPRRKIRDILTMEGHFTKIFVNREIDYLVIGTHISEDGWSKINKYVPHVPKITEDELMIKLEVYDVE